MPLRQNHGVFEIAPAHPILATLLRIGAILTISHNIAI